MEMTSERLDMSAQPYEELRVQPAAILKREPAEHWLSRQQPIGLQDQVKWMVAAEGDHVRIPLYPYFTHGVEPAVAMLYTFMLGFAALADVGNMKVKRVHVVFGEPVQEHMGPEGSRFRFWLGYAVKVEAP